MAFALFEERAKARTELRVVAPSLSPKYLRRLGAHDDGLRGGHSRERVDLDQVAAGALQLARGVFDELLRRLFGAGPLIGAAKAQARRRRECLDPRRFVRAGQGGGDPRHVADLSNEEAERIERRRKRMDAAQVEGPERGLVSDGAAERGGPDD